MWNTSLVPIQWVKPHDATKMPQLLCVKLEDPKKFTSQALRRSRAVIHLGFSPSGILAWLWAGDWDTPSPAPPTTDLGYINIRRGGSISLSYQLITMILIIQIVRPPLQVIIFLLRRWEIGSLESLTELFWNRLCCEKSEYQYGF